MEELKPVSRLCLGMKFDGPTFPFRISVEKEPLAGNVVLGKLGMD